MHCVSFLILTAEGPIQKLAGSRWPTGSSSRFVTSTCKEKQNIQCRFFVLFLLLTTVFSCFAAVHGLDPIARKKEKGTLIVLAQQENRVKKSKGLFFLPFIFADGGSKVINIIFFLALLYIQKRLHAALRIFLDGEIPKLHNEVSNVFMRVFLPSFSWCCDARRRMRKMVLRFFSLSLSSQSANEKKEAFLLALKILKGRRRNGCCCCSQELERERTYTQRVSEFGAWQSKDSLAVAAAAAAGEML